MVFSQLRAPFTKLMQPVYKFLANIGIHPNMITIMGLGLGFVSGWAFAMGEYMVAAVTIFLSGTLDVLDGGVARVGGYASSEGAFLDSVADRLGESAVYIGIVLGFTEILHQLLGLSILVLSYSISYLRARGEGLGVTLEGIGVMERAERMTALFIVGLIAHYFSFTVFLISLIFFMTLVFITVVHRFVRVYGALKLSGVPV